MVALNYTIFIEYEKYPRAIEIENQIPLCS